MIFLLFLLLFSLSFLSILSIADEAALVTNLGKNRTISLSFYPFHAYKGYPCSYNVVILIFLNN